MRAWLCLLVAPLWAASLQVMRADGTPCGPGAEVGGLCLVRIIPGPAEQVSDARVRVGDWVLPEADLPESLAFWLPCDSLPSEVVVAAQWRTGPRLHRATLPLRVRNVPLRLRVEVAGDVPPGRRLWAAGGLYQLGMLPDGTWQPRAFPLQPLGAGHWFGSLTVGPGDRCEVQFTLGGWGTKGRTPRGDVVRAKESIQEPASLAFRIAHFGIRKGSPGPIPPHLSIASPGGDRMVVAFRGTAQALFAGTNPARMPRIKLRRDAGGLFGEFGPLRPSQTWYYALGKDAQPVAVQIPDQELTFCVVGDIQSNPSVIEAMVGAVRPHLVLHVGDLVNDGWHEHEWTKNLEAVAPAASVAPYMVVPGNHEGESPLFREVFHFPGEEYYYAFSYGPCKFLMLDSEAPYEAGSPQRLFADSVLAAWRGSGLIFACIHSPPYSHGWHGGDRNVRRELCPLFEASGVTVVFSGHDHGYEATWPLRAGVRTDGGTVYVVTGGGGARLYETRPGLPSWSRGRHVRHHWVVVTATPSSATVRAMTPEGEVLDTFVVRVQSP